MFTVRRLLIQEYPKYRTHLKALDKDSKLLRFGHRVSDEVIDHLCDGIEKDTIHHILFCIENKDLDIVAVGHIATRDGMELAFSVFKEYQGQGLGSKLMKRCIQYCRTHGILKGCMVCLSSNSVIKHLCLKNGIHIHTEYGETMADLELDRPDVSTYVTEQYSSNLAMFDYMNKRSILPWSFK
ncbi:MAG: GNAT family N-acetyltransferase [Lentisphaerota bacterium]